MPFPIAGPTRHASVQFGQQCFVIDDEIRIQRQNAVFEVLEAVGSTYPPTAAFTTSKFTSGIRGAQLPLQLVRPRHSYEDTSALNVVEAARTAMRTVLGSTCSG